MEQETINYRGLTLKERVPISNEQRIAPWEIDTEVDPYDLPLSQVCPSNPRLFEARKAFRYFERLRKEDPIHYSENSIYGPYWSITCYDDIVAIEKQPKVFSSDSRYGGMHLASVPYVDGVANDRLPMFIQMDPPKHTKQRRVVQPLFLQKALQPIEDLIRTRAINILDNLPLDEEFDWVSNVSIELTAQMLATLFDIPQEDRLKLIHWSECIINANEPKMFETLEYPFDQLRECYDYFKEIFEERKKLPDAGQDLISMLAHDSTTQELPPNEFLGNILLLIVAGNDTVRNAISGGVCLLNEFPDEYTRLKENPQFVNSTIHEIIRMHSPVAYMARTTLEDTEYKGHMFKEGDRMALWYISANRDEDVFDDPNTFKIDRPNARSHIGFGFGIHHCLGNKLAELQLRILWEEVLKRYDRIEMVGDPVYLWSSFVHGITELPVRIKR